MRTDRQPETEGQSTWEMKKKVTGYTVNDLDKGRDQLQALMNIVIKCGRSRGQ
jgi:hypothetical protein